MRKKAKPKNLMSIKVLSVLDLKGQYYQDWDQDHKVGGYQGQVFYQNSIYKPERNADREHYIGVDREAFGMPGTDSFNELRNARTSRKHRGHEADYRYCIYIHCGNYIRNMAKQKTPLRAFLRKTYIY